MLNTDVIKYSEYTNFLTTDTIKNDELRIRKYTRHY